jgi:hypothetical protein
MLPALTLPVLWKAARLSRDVWLWRLRSAAPCTVESVARKRCASIVANPRFSDRAHGEMRIMRTQNMRSTPWENRIDAVARGDDSCPDAC